MARLQVLSAAFLFGTTGTAQALGPELPPLVVGASRIVLGGVLLLLLALLVGRLRVCASPAALLLAGACVAVYQACFFVAVADTGVAVGTVVAIGSAPAFAGLLSWAVAGERPDWRWGTATAAACAGVCLLVLGGAPGGEASALGVTLALVSGAGYAGYAVSSKRMLDAGGAPEGVMAAVFCTGGLLLVPVLVLAGPAGLATPGGAALAAYLAVVPTAIAYVLFARGLERIGASETATLTLAEPVTAALLGVVVLGERPGAVAALGAVLVLAGVGLLALRPKTAAGPRVRPAEAAA
jgi:drug/metabolite transporter, DME family